MLAQALGGALLVALRVLPSLLLVPVFGGVLLRPLVRFALALALALALGSGALAWPRGVPTDGWFLVLAGRELTLGVAMALVLSAPFFAVRTSASGSALNIAESAVRMKAESSTMRRRISLSWCVCAGVRRPRA